MVPVLLLLGLALAARPASAVIEVRQDGFGDATTVANGLLAAAPGEEVRITDGNTYNESGLVISGSRRLTSVPVGATISGSGVILTLAGGAENNRVEGVTVISNSLCIVVNAGDGSTPEIINTFVQGTDTLVTGIQVFNQVSSTLTPATVTLADVTFNILGTGLLHMNFGFGNVPEQAACNYSVSALDFAAIGGTCIRFTRPASGIFSGILADGISGNVITVDEGARFSQLSFNNVNALNFGDTGVYVNEDNVIVTLDSPTFSGGQRGVHLGDLLTPLTGLPTIELLGTGSITGASENGIRLDAACNLTLGAITITSTGTNATDAGLYASDFASGTTVTANGTIFQSNANRAVHAVSGVVSPGGNALWSFTNCRFLDSGTAEILFDGSSSTGNQLLLNRCLLREANARLAGGSSLMVLNSIDATLRNCVLELGDNHGLQHSGSSPLVLEHCTISAPVSSPVAAMSLAGTSLTVRNSVVDAPSGDVVTGISAWTESNNVFRGLISSSLLPLAATSQVADPVFSLPNLGPGTGNFVLLAGSPCPGGGDPAVGLTVDFNGVARPNPAATNPDIGAYETVLVPVELSGLALE